MFKFKFENEDPNYDSPNSQNIDSPNNLNNPEEDEILS